MEGSHAVRPWRTPWDLVVITHLGNGQTSRVAFATKTSGEGDGGDSTYRSAEPVSASMYSVCGGVPNWTGTIYSSSIPSGAI